MRETIEIGSTPWGEDCAQVGEDNYTVKARRECNVFCNQIRRVFGTEPEGVALRIKSNPHDFGSYYEVAMTFDVEDAGAADYVFKVENNVPETWDDEARKELGL